MSDTTRDVPKAIAAEQLRLDHVQGRLNARADRAALAAQLVDAGATEAEAAEAVEEQDDVMVQIARALRRVATALEDRPRT